MTRDNTEKEDRQERYQRRRSQASVASSDDTSRRRRAEPYKRQQVNYEDYLDDDLEEWPD